jgi:hypothetical protein
VGQRLKWRRACRDGRQQAFRPLVLREGVAHGEHRQRGITGRDAVAHRGLGQPGCQRVACQLRGRHAVALEGAQGAPMEDAPTALPQLGVDDLDLANLPAQPRPPSVGRRPVQGATLTFKTLYVLVFVAHGRGELVQVNVTAHPTAAWVWRQLIEAPPGATSRGIRSAIEVLSMAATSAGALDGSASTAALHPFDRRVRGRSSRESSGHVGANVWTTSSYWTSELPERGQGFALRQPPCQGTVIAHD